MTKEQIAALKGMSLMNWPEFAATVGVTRKAAMAWAAGRNAPSVRHVRGLWALAEKLGKSANVRRIKASDPAKQAVAAVRGKR